MVGSLIGPASSASSFSRLADARRTRVVDVVPSARDGPHASILATVLAATVMLILEVVNCVSVALILRGTWPNELIDPLFRHVTYGFILTQLVSSALSKFPGVIAGSAFENLVIFGAIREAVVDALKTKSLDVQVVTFLSCVVLSTLISSIVLTLMSMPRVNAILKYLPEYVRQGVFMAVGICIFMLGFDSFELDPFAISTWTSGVSLLKWCPAYVIGVGLWYISEHYPSRYLLLGFIAVIIVGVHLILLCAGMSLHDAASGGWVLAELESRNFSEYFNMTYASLGLVDINVVFSCLPAICTASLVGPVLNVSINVLVLEGMLEVKNLSYSTEFLSQALGNFAASLGFGFNSYFAVSDTAIAQKVGATSSRPIVVMCAMLFFICLIPPATPFLTIVIPILLPACIFVYIGIDIVLGCLGEMKESLTAMEYSFSLLTCCLCVVSSLPKGLFCACAVCAFQHSTLLLPSVQNSEIASRRSADMPPPAGAPPSLLQLSARGAGDA